ncbi:GNAT family N-acetyltransferase [Agromyces mediolanus]|uniref:GNAT family N-acetyltransferase n=1 Tax=Agromyces mediolanus TaxID=41986 RepID=UPI003833B05E
MLQHREVDVADDDAQTMLTAYFDERAAGFPPEQGEYRPTFPDPAQFAAPAGAFLLVVDGDGRAVGCGGVRRIQRSPEPEQLVRFEVKHLWLAPAARGGGEGRRLLDALERRARELGAQELVLDTNRSLEAAGGLYRASGFTPIEPYNANPNATDWFGKRLG